MPIRVLIVDDSPTMRAIIKRALRLESDIVVVGEAGDPFEAREAIKALSPHVVTLDVEMPRMSGLEFLERLMRLRPTPVIMISTLTSAGAEKAVEALAKGAVACVGKPANPGSETAFQELPDLIREAAAAKVDIPAAQNPPAVRGSDFVPNGKVVVIGSSTGGVEALMQVISAFPKNCPPTLITQHMPPGFTKSFAARMNLNSAATVTEAVDGAVLEPGKVYLAPGGHSHLTLSGRHRKTCRLTEGAQVNGHCPSVDVLFHSASALGDQAVGVILTGMGRDGAEGLLAIRQSGGATVGQNKQSCVVYGMPKVAFEIGAVEQQLPLSAIAQSVLDRCEAR